MKIEGTSNVKRASAKAYEKKALGASVFLLEEERENAFSERPGPNTLVQVLPLDAYPLFLSLLSPSRVTHLPEP